MVKTYVDVDLEGNIDLTYTHVTSTWRETLSTIQGENQCRLNVDLDDNIFLTSTWRDKTYVDM